MDKALINNTEDQLVDAFSQLISMQESDLAEKSVGLYRAMFRHETDVNKLDFNYADWILDYVMFGHELAIEDYKNYLQYLKSFSRKEYVLHQQMLEEELTAEKQEE